MTDDERVRWKPQFTREPEVPLLNLSSDALDRAAWAAFRAAAGVTAETEAEAQWSWDRMSPKEREGWRREAAAPLLVMAEDIRRMTAYWHDQYKAYADSGEVYGACADLIGEILEDYGV